MENVVKPLITKLFLYLVKEESESPWYKKRTRYLRPRHIYIVGSTIRKWMWTCS
jgi:hypothetical protein